MEKKQGFRRWAAAFGGLMLLAGGAALWLSADTGQVQANAPLPVRQAAALPDMQEEAEEVLLAEPRSKPRSKEEQRFARADRDDDGMITQAEYLAQRRRNFDKLDANGDGVLQFEEYAVSGISKFRKADADGDGRLRPVEFATTATKTATNPAKSRVATAAAPCPSLGAVQQNGDADA